VKDELFDKLRSDYPKLFAANPSFHARDGWYHLIDDVCDIISTHIEYTYPIEIQEQMTISQIKEKFGTLRFYMNHEDDHMHGVITMAELYSSHVCEVCGNLGHTLNVRGWVQTLCDVCLAKNQEEYEAREADRLSKKGDVGDSSTD
jgi:hypothetical protein